VLEFLPDCNEEIRGLQIKHKSRERRNGKKREERKERYSFQTPPKYINLVPKKPPPQK
jgi:hypothetical protein